MGASAGGTTGLGFLRTAGYHRAMTDTPPDHLASDPSSPHYDETAMARGVGIRFKGNERNDVEEYCVSEGWVRVALGKKVHRHGQPVTIRLTGEVEPYFRSETAAT